MPGYVSVCNPVCIQIYFPWCQVLSVVLRIDLIGQAEYGYISVCPGWNMRYHIGVFQPWQVANNLYIGLSSVFKGTQIRGKA